MVPQLWTGRTVAVLASGPSMSQSVADRVRAAGLPAIVTNDTYKLAPWADLLYAADSRWWDVHPAALDFDGLKVSCHPHCRQPGVMLLKQTGIDGFDPEPGCVRTGGNSGYQAIHVAIHGGAERILLCGFDMKGAHWFGLHKSPLRNSHPDNFNVWVRRFKNLVRHGDIVNCTPGSVIECFRRMDLDAALAEETEKWLAVAR